VEADGKGAESLRYICSRIYTIHGIFQNLIDTNGEFRGMDNSI
jgi:hypothetical protein